jgi:hypothetical protein
MSESALVMRDSPNAASAKNTEADVDIRGARHALNIVD